MTFNLELKAHQYRRMLEERRGNNFEYWNEEKHNKMLKKGWYLFNFSDRKGNPCKATTLKGEAKDIVEALRKNNNFARIICGYHKDAQRRKHYSVIYKSKK